MSTSRRHALRTAIGLGGLSAAAVALPVSSAAAATAALDWIFPAADPTGATDSTAAINAALGAATPGQVVYLGAGTYQTTAPLVVPPGVTLLGSHGGHTDLGPSTDAAGDAVDYTACTIRPAAGFTGKSLAATSTDTATTVNAVVLLLDQVSGGYATASFEQRVARLTIDGSKLPSTGSVNGIEAVGHVHGVCLDDIEIADVSGRGVCGLGRNGGNPYSWRLSRVCVTAARGPYGFNIANFTDTLFEDCETLGVSGSGWYIAGNGNSQFTNCRAERSGHYGFEVHSGGVSGYVFTGCTTDRNSYHGMYITDSGGTGPILLDGCYFNRDGRNGGAGGAYAGLAVNGSSSPIVVHGCVTAVHPDDGGTGLPTPEYGISVTDAAYVTVQGGFFWGTTQGWNDGGGNTVFNRGPNVGAASGQNTTASPQVLSVLDSGAFTIGLDTADATGLTVRNTSSNVNHPLLQLTAGSSGSDALLKAGVAGDTSSRVILSANGQLSLGSGATASQDASWGRLAPAQIGSPDSDLVAGLAGRGLKVKEGTNAKMGTLTLNGATAVTVATTAATATSRIFLTVQAPGGTPAGVAYVSGRTAGASFSVKGVAGDTSTVAWLIVEPA